MFCPVKLVIMFVRKKTYKCPRKKRTDSVQRLGWSALQERDLCFLLHFAGDWAKNLLDILMSCRDILAGKGQDLLS